MSTQTAVVLGAAGLTGSGLVQHLLNDTAFSKVRILVRKQVALLHPKLEVQVVDFDNLPQFRAAIGEGDCIFCCIGTTISKVKGDKAAYWKIDVDIPVNAAKMALDAGFTCYLLVSSVGAKATSRNFYLRLKGEAEKEIAALNFPSFHTFRPGILLGDRKEKRLSEKLGKALMRVIAPALTGRFKKYRAIESDTVARAMVAAAKSTGKGMFVHHYSDIMIYD